MVWLRRLLMLHMSAASTRTIAGAGTRQGARVLNAYLTNDPGECGA